MKKQSVVRNPNGLGVKVETKKAPDLINRNNTTDWNPISNYRAVGEPVEVVKALLKPSYAQWVDDQLVKIPEDFHAGIKAKYSELLHSREHESEGVRLANNFILDAMDLFANFGRKRLVANEHLSQVAAMQVRLFGLDSAAEWAKQQGVRVPRFPTEENNLDVTKRNSREAVAARLCSPEWWDRQLTKRSRNSKIGVNFLPLDRKYARVRKSLRWFPRKNCKESPTFAGIRVFAPSSLANRLASYWATLPFTIPFQFRPDNISHLFRGGVWRCYSHARL